MLCKHCGVEMRAGIATGQTVVSGETDFPGSDVVTMSAGGPGVIIKCLKCPECGWSVSGSFTGVSKPSNPKDAVGVAKWRQFMPVPRQVLWEVGVGMLEGAAKYGRHNYRAAGVRASIYVDAAIGHLDQFVEGEDIDKDSGLSHVTKAICSLIVLRDAMMNDFWVDDRPPKIADMDGVRERLQAKVEEIFDRYGDVRPVHYTEVAHGSGYAKRQNDPEWAEPDS